MMKMMGKIKEAQEKMKKIKDELDTIEVKTESGAGLVSVVVNGKKELISIKIDFKLLNKSCFFSIITSSGFLLPPAEEVPSIQE